MNTLKTNGKSKQRKRINNKGPNKKFQNLVKL